MSWNPTHIQVAVQRARSLISKGKSGTNDVYATIGLGKEKFHTTLKEKATDPEWYEECDLALPEKYEDSHIEIVVLHRNGIGLDEFLGRIELPLRNYSIHDPPRSQWYALLPKPGHTKNFQRGELEVRLCYIVGKVKDPDSISTASSASKRLKIGKKMMSALGEKLHVKKKEKTKDHIPDLTGLDEGVLDDEDIAENYSISIKVPSKNDARSRHDDSPPSTVQPSTFTKFTPFPKEKSDAPRSPSSSIVSEEDLAQKHGDATSEHSFEMGYGHAGRGPTRSSGGKPRKLSLGKRGLISKDKSQSVWEISNTKSEFGVAAGLKATIGTSKEEGDSLASKQLSNIATKDRVDLSEPHRKSEDSDLANRAKPSTATAATSAGAAGAAAADPIKGSTMVHEVVTPQGTAKTGALKIELKQTPVLVDDDDDDLDDAVTSPSVRLAGTVGGIMQSPGVALRKPANAADLAKPAGDLTRIGFGDSATLPAPSITNKKGTPDAAARSTLAVEADKPATGVPVSFASKGSGAKGSAFATAVATSSVDAQPSNPFVSSSQEAKQKLANDFVESGKEAGLPGKQHGVNPFEDILVSKPTPKSTPVNPFDDEDGQDHDAAPPANDRTGVIPRVEPPRTIEGDVTAVVQRHQSETRVKAIGVPVNPFEDSINDVSARRPAAATQPQAQHVLALDPPAVETVTLPVVDDNMLKTLVVEPAAKDTKASRKVLSSAQHRGPLREPARQQAAVTEPVPAVTDSVSAVTTLRNALTAVHPPADEPLPAAAAPSQPSGKASGGADVRSSSRGVTSVTTAAGVLSKASSNPFEEEDGSNADGHNTSGLATSQPAFLSDSSRSATTRPADTSNVVNVVGSAGVAPFAPSFTKSRKMQAPLVPTASVTAAHTVQSPADSTHEGAPSLVSSSATKPAMSGTMSSAAAVPATSTALSPATTTAADTMVATPSSTSSVQASIAKPAMLLKAGAAPSATETSPSNRESKPYDKSSTSLTSANGSMDPKSRVRSSTEGTNADESDRPAGGSKRNASMNVAETASVDVKHPGGRDADTTKVLPATSPFDDMPRSGKGSPSKGSMLDAVVAGHSLTSAMTFKDESTSTLSARPLMTDCATQTFDNQDNIPQEYKGLNKEVLVEMVLKMKSQLAAKEGQVRDLEEYIDQLLLRVMDGNPALLIHSDQPAKNRPGKR